MSNQDVREDLHNLITLENANNTGLTNNKVINFAYTNEAYTEGSTYNPASVDSYNPNNTNNIPSASSDVMHIEAEVLNKGLRDNATSLAKETVNHFFGRVSFNLNKAHDWLLRLMNIFDVFMTDSVCVWNTYTTYEIGQVVCVLDNNGHGTFYKSVIADNKGNIPSENPNMWNILSFAEQ